MADRLVIWDSQFLNFFKYIVSFCKSSISHLEVKCPHLENKDNTVLDLLASEDSEIMTLEKYRI